MLALRNRLLEYYFPLNHHNKLIIWILIIIYVIICIIFLLFFSLEFNTKYTAISLPPSNAGALGISSLTSNYTSNCTYPDINNLNINDLFTQKSLNNYIFSWTESRTLDFGFNTNSDWKFV